MRPKLTDSTLYAGDPYPTYAWLREHAPVYWDDESRLWVLSRYHDVVHVSKTAEIFSAAQGVLPETDTLVSIVCMDDPRPGQDERLGGRVRRVRDVPEGGLRGTSRAAA